MLGFLTTCTQSACLNASTLLSRYYSDFSKTGRIFPEEFFSSISRFFYRVTLPYSSHFSEKVSIIHDDANSTIRKLIALTEAIELTKKVQLTPEEAASLILATQKIDQTALSALSSFQAIASLNIEIAGSGEISANLSLFQKKILLHLSKATKDQANTFISSIHEYLFKTHLDYRLMLVSQEQFNTDSSKTTEAIKNLLVNPPLNVDGRRAKLRIKRFFTWFSGEYCQNSQTYAKLQQLIEKFNQSSR